MASAFGGADMEDLWLDELARIDAEELGERLDEEERDLVECEHDYAEGTWAL
jgi:hypothetical protein